MPPKIGTPREFVDGGKERTVDSSPSSESAESQEWDPITGRSGRGERPPALGTTQTSMSRSSPTLRSLASPDYSRSRHRTNRST
jgi:hypothetical protein